jgi:hypothetical protein
MRIKKHISSETETFICSEIVIVPVATSVRCLKPITWLSTILILFFLMC